MIRHPISELYSFEMGWRIDRKSTRLKSSHSQISYAVFCLKKKKNTPTRQLPNHSTRSANPNQATPPRRSSRPHDLHTAPTTAHVLHLPHPPYGSREPPAHP